MSDFDNVNSTYSLIREIVILRNLVKCPICLDVVNNPLQISCNHIFCGVCIDTFIDQTFCNLTCPICRKSIKRQRQTPNDSIKQLIKFVTRVSEKFKNHFQCDILNTPENVLNALINNRNNTTTPTVDTKHQSKLVSKLELPKKILHHAQPKLPTEDKNDAFDLLRASPDRLSFKKQETRRTYCGKKNEKEQNAEYYPNLINFQDDSYRAEIIEWLCDSRNKFDRLTQTQSIIDDDSNSEESSFDMPSISQDEQLISYKTKPFRRFKERTRSLEIKVKRTKIKSRRYSFSGDSQNNVEDVNIEEIESDKDGLGEEQINILQMLEEKCLNSIESELAVQKNEKCDTKKTKKLKKRKRKTGVDAIAKPTTSGWIRAKQMNKTLRRTAREPKRLYMSLPSSSKLGRKTILENSAKIDNAVHNANQRPVVLLSRLSNELELYKSHADVMKPKEYSLFEVENYISNNISRADSCPVKNNAGVNENAILRSDKCEIICNEDIQNSTNKVEELDLALKTNENSIKTEVGPSDSIFSQQHAVDDTNDLFNVPTQKIICESQLDKVETALMALFSSQTELKKDNAPSDSVITKTAIINEISSLLSQLDVAANTLGSLFANNSNIDDMKMYIEKLNLMFNNLKAYSEMPDHCCLQGETKQYFSSTTQTVMLSMQSIAIQTEEWNSSGFKISSTAEFQTLVRCNAEVQTDYVSTDGLVSKLARMTNITQFENDRDGVLMRRTVATQTETTEGEPICVKFNTTSADQTSMILQINNEVDDNKEYYTFTESMDNINFDTQAVVNQNKMSDVKDVFREKGNSPVMRNTQDNKIGSDIQRERQVKKKLMFNKVLERSVSNNDDDIIIEDEENLVPAPVNFDTIDESTPAKKSDKEVESKTTPKSTVSFLMSLDKCNKPALSMNTINRFKRARAIMEDGDADDGFLKRSKKKENPYLVQDLSVEIISQDVDIVSDEIEMRQEDKCPPSASQSLNYDELLEKIMQNSYDEKSIRTSTPKKEQPKKTRSQHIVDKCNALIQEAAASPITPPPAKKTRCAIDNNITSEDVAKEFDLPFNETKSSNVKIKSPTQNMPFSNVESIAHEFGNELQPTFDKAIDGEDKSSRELVVLQNILLEVDSGENESTRLQYNLDEEWRKMDNVDRVSEKSEEVFSDYDVDVVETTPQKVKPPNMIFGCQSLHNRCSSGDSTPMELPPPDDSPDVVLGTETVAYLNETFEPPTEFQDCVGDNIINDKQNVADTGDDDFDLTLVPSNVAKVGYFDMDATLTVKESLPQTRQLYYDTKQGKIEDCSVYDDLPKKPVTTKNNRVDELSNTTQSTNIRDINPIERALKSNYNPLEIVSPRIHTTKLLSLHTSTPKSQKSILSYLNCQLKTNQRSTGDLELVEKPCIACTRLSKDQVIAICALTNKKLATYSTSFNSTVTHMIVSLNKDKCIEDHTMKFVSAVAAGIWVLGFDWIQECLSKNKIVPETPFEALDVSGLPGPKTSRLTRLKNPLFKGFQIHAAPPFMSISKEDLENVITMLGGEIVPSLEGLEGKSGIRLIITEAKATQDFEIYETWLESFKVMTVDIEWLSRSVGQYRLLSLKPFALCSDDYIDELGYPEQLLVDTPFSFAQSMYSS